MWLRSPLHHGFCQISNANSLINSRCNPLIFVELESSLGVIYRIAFSFPLSAYLLLFVEPSFWLILVVCCCYCACSWSFLLLLLLICPYCCYHHLLLFLLMCLSFYKLVSLFGLIVILVGCWYTDCSWYSLMFLILLLLRLLFLLMLLLSFILVVRYCCCCFACAYLAYWAHLCCENFEQNLEHKNKCWILNLFWNLSLK